jgi:hypothetical protein
LTAGVLYYLQLNLNRFTALIECYLYDHVFLSF